MPGIIDTETMNVDALPGVWAPVQWDQTDEERAQEVENQAAAGLLSIVDTPEAILRLLLNETQAEITYSPPPHYDTEQQGEWDENLLTFAFRRPMRLAEIKREPDFLQVEYDFGDLGHWVLQIEPERVNIERI